MIPLSEEWGPLFLHVIWEDPRVYLPRCEQVGASHKPVQSEDSLLAVNGTWHGGGFENHPLVAI